MSHVSYIIETNGENGVYLEYVLLSYEPATITWVNGENSFGMGEPLPDVDTQSAPTYARRWNGDGWDYYRRTVKMPSKTTSFLLSVLIDGAENNGGYVYDTFTSFFTTTPKGGLLEVVSKTNTSLGEREGTITIKDNQYGETLEVFVVQECTSIALSLISYTSYGMNGEQSGMVPRPMSLSFPHTFYWLTEQTAFNKETLSVEVGAMGPRNGYIILDISKFVYDGELDESCVYSMETGKYYKTLQRCTNGGLETVSEEIIFDNTTQAVYTKVRYTNDLTVVKNGNYVNITSYGRCFIEDDAYYVITLANVDDLETTCEIVLRYTNDEPNNGRNRGGVFANPSLYMMNGRVMMHTDNESDAELYFRYRVSFENGQLVYRTTMPDFLESRIENNELIATIND